MKPTLQHEQRLQKYANTHPLDMSCIRRETAELRHHRKKPPLSSFIGRPGRSARGARVRNGERPR